MPVPKSYVVFLSIFSEWRWEVIVCFVVLVKVLTTTVKISFHNTYKSLQNKIFTSTIHNFRAYMKSGSFYPYNSRVHHVSTKHAMGQSWPWSYGSWIYNYLCNHCLSPLMLWVRILIRARCTTLCDKVCRWLATGLWFSVGTPVFFTNKTDRHDITEILFKVALNNTKQTNEPFKKKFFKVFE